MISLPPGVTINYEVTVAVSNISYDFRIWWEEIGGEYMEAIGYTARGEEYLVPVVKYGRGRLSHKMAGNDEYLIRFRGEDANVALMLLMKWDNLVIRHNMREIEKMKEAHYG